MYDGDYAKTWMEYEGTNQDILRREHIIPYLQRILAQDKTDVKILDVGCGWGCVLDFIPENYEYTGIDPTIQFLDYVRAKHSTRRFELVQGKLPDLPIGNALFDVVLCSMVLHCIPDLETSIDTLFKKVRSDGKVVIVDFNDDAESIVRSRFQRIDEDRPDYIKGIYNLSDEIQLYGESYFHKEAEIESTLRKYGAFNKTHLGPLFVGYEI